MLIGKIAAAGAMLMMALGLAFQPADWIVFNNSPSVPRRFYVRLHEPPERGAFVTVRARDVAPSYAASRSFVGPRDRFIKRVAATEGQRVCATGVEVIVGNLHLQRMSEDHRGHALPNWGGCHELLAGEFFLLGDTTDSFDSRYFGVVRQEQIEGVWRRL